MKNRRRAILMTSLQIFALFAIVSIGPGTAPVAGAQVPAFFPGDWVLPENTTEEYTGGTADVTGSIIINNGAKLILHGAAIQMNPATDGSTEIQVFGTLDADNTTFESNTAAHYNMNLNNPTTVSNLLDCDISGLRAMFIASGFVTLKRNTVHSSLYGPLISQPMQPVIENNTFRDMDNRAMEVFQSNAKIINNVFNNNNVGGTDFGGIVIAEGDPTFDGNTVTGNSVSGMLVADIAQWSFHDCTLNNQGATDIRVETTNKKTNIHAYGSTFSTVTLNEEFNSSDATFTRYWTIDVEVELESDSSPVDNALIDVKTGDGTLVIGNKHTDASGQLLAFEVPEYEMSNDRETTTTDDYKPHVVWATKEIGGIMLSSNTTIDIDQDMKVDIILDDIPPPLTVTSPTSGFMTNLTTVEFSGTTEPTASLMIKGEPVTVETNGSYLATVKLSEGKNNIKVVSTDESGNPTQIIVEVIRDTFAPEVQIKTPENGTWTNNPDLNVTGTAEYGSTLRINGKPVTIEEDGTFHAIIRLMEGKNALKAEATDNVSNTGVDEITVFLDSIPPVLTLVEPTTDRKTSEKEMNFFGVIEIGATLTIDGETVSYQGSTFKHIVTLDEGDNEIVVAATDAIGNVNTIVRNIHLDTIPPVITITSPQNLFETNQAKVTVTGYTEPDADIKVNGMRVDNDDGNFTTEVPLETNNNLINVTVSDDVGNSASKEIRVIKDTIPPDLVVLTPEEGTVFNSMSAGKVTVTGSSDSNAFVFVNDQRADMTGTSFKIIMYLEEGENTLEVEARDVAGNINSEVLTVYYDNHVDYQVTAPSEGTTVKSKKITASGSVEPGGTVRINGEEAVVDADGYFTHDTKLEPGENTITFVFEDAAGNSWTESIHVKRKGGEPVEPLISSGMLMGILGLVVAIVIVVVVIMLVMKMRGRRPKPEEVSDEPPPPDFAAAGVMPQGGHDAPDPSLPPPPPPEYYQQLHQQQYQQDRSQGPPQ